MITFPETLDALERLSDNLKGIDDLDSVLRDADDDLEGYLQLLQFAHNKNFKDAEDALAYIDQVLVPQLRGLRDALKTGRRDPIKRLKLASDQTERLVLRLRMVVNGDMGEFLP
jgi:hypothetical protein